MRTTKPPDHRPKVCPGCYGALIRGRRARPGRPCSDCLRDRVREIAAKGKR